MAVSPQLYCWLPLDTRRFQFGGSVWVYRVVPHRFRSYTRPTYLIDEFHGVPVAHDGMARPSLSDPPATEESRMITVLSRTLGTAGQGWVVRMTSANRAVLLVPSVMVTIGTPRRSWPLGAGPAKMPAPGPVVPICDVVP